jgi:hypothetical protein
MSLSIAAIDRLFERLELSYGGEWVRKWEKSPIEDVKSMWAHELSHYANNLQAIAWALENLPERCPNVIEFRNLCRNAPAPEAPRLPEPKAAPARVAAELSKLGEIKKKVLSSPAGVGDGREWARRIMGRYEAGEKLNICTLRFAREALGVKAA